MAEPPHRSTAPSAYGEAFADVYDRWYGDGDTADALAALEGLRPGLGRLLEIGAGTGRLAVPIAERGWTVTALDASPAMQSRLRERAATAGVAIDTHTADAGDATTWPPGPFDVVLAAFNMVFNLPSRSAQQQMFAASADRLVPNGVLIVQSFRPAPPAGPRRRTSLAAVDVDAVRFMVTNSDESSGVVDGTHIEVRVGELPTRRHWRILPTTMADLDRFAAAVGLELIHRWGDFDCRPFDVARDSHHVSVYSPVGPSAAG